MQMKRYTSLQTGGNFPDDSSMEATTSTVETMDRRATLRRHNSAPLSNHDLTFSMYSNTNSSIDDPPIIYHRSASLQSGLGVPNNSIRMSSSAMLSKQKSENNLFPESHFPTHENKRNASWNTASLTSSLTSSSASYRDSIQHNEIASFRNMVHDNGTVERIRVRRAARRNHRSSMKNSSEKSLDDSNSSRTRIDLNPIRDLNPLRINSGQTCPLVSPNHDESFREGSSSPKVHKSSLKSHQGADMNGTKDKIPMSESSSPKKSAPDSNTIVSGQITKAMEKRAITQNFVMEHKIFLRAILQLLYEREQYAIEEADVNDPNSTLKTGPLKKASIGGVFWKVKYVEIRRGVFSYYEDDISEGGELQCKSLPLRADQCSCRAVKVTKRSNKTAQSINVITNMNNSNMQNRKSSDDESNPLTTGAIFELTIGGGSRRLWMANSREERQAWIRAIYSAMIGGPVMRGDNFFNYQRESKRNSGKKLSKSKIPNRSPYKADLEKYLAVQNKLKHASSKTQYINGLTYVYGKSLYVPVEWIKELMEEIGSPSRPSMKKKKKKSFNGSERHEKSGAISSEVSQLWKDMLRDNLSINGVLYEGGSGNGPEKIVGALTQCILNFDRSSTYNDEEYINDQDNIKIRKSLNKKQQIIESQAVVYARDILLACNRTRSGGDSYLCVESLCRNPELVVLCPSSTQGEPLKITVRHSSLDELQKHSKVIQDPSDLSGWVYVRKRSQKFWKQRFCVLSGDTLSFYKKALPRPHIFRGSLRLKMTSITFRNTSDSALNRSMNYTNNKSLSSFIGQKQLQASKSPATKINIVSIVTKRELAQEHQLLFVDESNFLLWKQHIFSAIEQSNDDDDNLLPTKSDGSTIISPSSKLSMNIHDTTDLQQHDALDADSGAETYDTADEKNTRITPLVPSKLKPLGGTKSRPTVEISVQVSNVYKICTIDPQGEESEDTWAMLRTNFLQNFRLSGGPNGRMTRGEEIVHLDCLKGLVTDDAFDHAYFQNADT